MAKIGFKRLTIRILDGEATPTVGENVFVIEGLQGKGATQTMKISGLASESTKTYGSDVAYYASRKGVGNVSVELGLLDVPAEVVSKILGYKEKNGITLVGADTEAPYCAILMESSGLDGKPCGFGFFKGVFSFDGEEFKTLEEKQDQLPTETFTFTALASDKADYLGQYMGSLVGADEAKMTAFKKVLDIAPNN